MRNLILSMFLIITIFIAGCGEGEEKKDSSDKPTIALIRYLSTGDFFQSYLGGVEAQARALDINLRILDSRQDAALQADMIAQAIQLGVDGIIIQHGLTESVKQPIQEALDAGIKVVAFDVNAENPQVPQIEQNDYLLAQLSLDQAIKDNGESFNAAYVYVPGVAPLDRRDSIWEKTKKKYPNIKEIARFGTLNNPIPNAIADQASASLRSKPEISVIFAPYNEFAKGVKLAVDELGISENIKIYSADISSSDIQEMRKENSSWVATAATNPRVIGEVSVRTLMLLLKGEKVEPRVFIPPTLITRQLLIDQNIHNMEDLEKAVPSFRHVDISVAPWMKLPN